MSLGDNYRTPTRPSQKKSLSTSLAQECHISEATTSTPAKQQTKSNLADANEDSKNRRRDWLCDQFQGHITDMSFDHLVSILCISTDFEQFRNRFRGVFIAMAFRAPAYVDKKLSQPNINIDQMSRMFTADKAISDSQLNCLDGLRDMELLGRRNEEALVAYFIELMQMVRFAQSSFSPTELQSWPISAYSLFESQNTAVAGGKHKIDCAFYYNNHMDRSFSSIHIPVEAKSAARGNSMLDKDFGQMADYARDLWKCQPTRAFVPVLFLHGHRMKLLIFTRGTCFQVTLMDYCYSTIRPSMYSINGVCESLSMLTFLLTLPPQKFGHFCDISTRKLRCLQFSHNVDSKDDTQSSALAYATVVSEETDGAIMLDEANRIKRPVNPRSRLVHIYRVLYRGEAAFLKLSWTPTDRLPESAVYDALQRANVENTPEVFDMGILDADAFGYRIEYLIIQDCGVSLSNYLTSQSSSQTALCDTIEQLMRQVIGCLLQAWKAGILHRDISMGNVAVSKGKATVIDWGYAKLIECDACDIDSLATKWMFEKGKVMNNEDAHNSITGTPLFMSIPILVRATKRSIVDDIESAFYVVLDALAAIQNASSKHKPVAMDFKDNRNLAFVRVGCLSTAEMYLETFGVRECTDKLRELLDALYRYLFVRDEKFIGGYLAIIPDYDRSVEEQELSGILNGATRSRRGHDAGNTPITRVTGPLRRSARLKRTRKDGDSHTSTHTSVSDISTSAMPQPPSKHKRTK